MSYEITLTDDTTTATFDSLEIPLGEDVIEGAVDVTTLDRNVFTDFFANKKMWSHRWANLTEDEFNTLKGFYDRQFTLFEYPLLTITELGVSNQPVRMTLTPRRIIDNCGTVQDVSVGFRQTVQMST